MGWNVYAFDAIFSLSYKILYTYYLVSNNNHDKNPNVWCKMILPNYILRESYSHSKLHIKY